MASKTTISRIIARIRSFTQSLLPEWSWRIDGGLVAAIVTAIAAAHYFPTSLITLYLNGLALFAFGYMLKRNLKRDTSWKDLRDEIRNKANSRRRK